MRTDTRIWRTDDGRHVPDGHRDAAFLAYGIGDHVPDEVIDELTGKPAAKPKARRKPADKAKARPSDKSVSEGDESPEATGSGVTITKLGDKPQDRTGED